MKLLLDESVPRGLRNHLSDHAVWTVSVMDWKGASNGELLELATRNSFQILITSDRKLPYQPNLKRHAIAVVVLVAPTNRLIDYLPLLPKLIATLNAVIAGRAVEITAERASDSSPRSLRK